MIGFNEKDGVLHADNVPLTQLAEEFGTPLYVYSAGVIRAQYKALSDAMANALPKDRQPMLCYACVVLVLCLCLCCVRSVATRRGLETIWRDLEVLGGIWGVPGGYLGGTWRVSGGTWCKVGRSTQ